MAHLRMGGVFRYARPYSVTPQFDGDLPNFFAFTETTGLTKPLLDRGISPIAAIDAVDGRRTPAILISSSPHKIGSEGTPWQDVFDVDNGSIRYFGDNKSSVAASLAPGNKLLRDQFQFHTSPDPSERAKAIPVLFFERGEVDGRKYGNVRFQGLGIIQRVELVTQFQKDIGYFTNYVFEFAILSLSTENEDFDWDWISARRDPALSVGEAEKLAPKAWKDWQKQGQLVLERHRRRVSMFDLKTKGEQLPEPGSRADRALTTIYKYYDGKKHRFELLASRVVQGLISNSGGHYQEGWITRGSGDGGVDFVGRVDLGTGFSKVKILVLGQAKCEKPTSGTSGRDLARTVARLKRGWVGAYVTTSFFTEMSQIEIFEDQYPLLTVNGLALAEEALRLQIESGFATLEEFLVSLEAEYSSMVMNRRPEEILRD